MKPYLLPLGLLLALAACKTDNPEAGLPRATQQGKNTGGCLINGKVFTATGYGSGLSYTDGMWGGFFYDSLYSLDLSGRQGGQNVTITLFLRSQAPGIYPLIQNTPTLLQGGLNHTLDHATYTVSNNTGETYVTSAQHTGQIHLTHANRSTGISAGTFSFTAASTFDRTKTVTITHGRFDCKQ